GWREYSADSPQPYGVAHMHKLNFTEDILAILIGAGLLVLAAVAWIVLPYASAAAELALATASASADPTFDPASWRPQETPGALADLLEALIIDLGRWNLNPLAAFSGAAGVAFVLLTLVLGLLFSIGVQERL